MQTALPPAVPVPCYPIEVIHSTVRAEAAACPARGLDLHEMPSSSQGRDGVPPLAECTGASPTGHPRGRTGCGGGGTLRKQPPGSAWSRNALSIRREQSAGSPTLSTGAMLVVQQMQRHHVCRKRGFWRRRFIHGDVIKRSVLRVTVTAQFAQPRHHASLHRECLLESPIIRWITRMLSPQ